MNLKIRGKAFNVTDTIVGKVSKEDNGTIEVIFDSAVVCYLTQDVSFSIKLPYIFTTEGFDNLFNNDIVTIDSRGIIHIVYRINSQHNSLLVTEMCNSNCLMCSQPPKVRDDRDFLFRINKKIVSLIPKDCRSLGITGGEPTLLGNNFFELLQYISAELPKTEVHILSNGRSFYSKEFTHRLKDVNTEKMVFGIPLYSDFYAQHDYIVQAKNAYYQTVLGLHHLAEINIRIEIRIVLHKLTIDRLRSLSEFIYKNLPFVEHIAFMGLENTGYTSYNFDKLWIDPVEYMEQLHFSVTFLDSLGFNVSIYNLQLCLLPKDLWKYSTKAISDWKNIYLEECSKCEVQESCGGFFLFNKNAHSEFIQPILNLRGVI